MSECLHTDMASVVSVHCRVNLPEAMTHTADLILLFVICLVHVTKVQMYI